MSGRAFGRAARVAALYDIHGNLPALEAVLAELDVIEPDLVLVGGDVASGPMPRETLDVLLGLGERATFIRGNADREVVEILERRREAKPGGLSDRWVGEQLTDEQRRFLAALPETARVEVESLGPVLFCHGSPRSDEEIITRATSEARLRDILAGVDESTVVCGHTHVQFDRVVGGVRVVNAGSVGMSYGEPAACWALFGPTVELRQTDYDLEDAAARIRRSDWPLAEEFAAENVLTRPSAEEVTELFESWAEERAAGAR